MWYWVCVGITFACASGFHQLNHGGHTFWAGIVLGVGFCAAEQAITLNVLKKRSE